MSGDAAVCCGVRFGGAAVRRGAPFVGAAVRRGATVVGTERVVARRADALLNAKKTTSYCYVMRY